MKSFARLGGLKEAPASIGGEYFTGCKKRKKKAETQNRKCTGRKGRTKLISNNILSAKPRVRRLQTVSDKSPKRNFKHLLEICKKHFMLFTSAIAALTA